MASPVARWAIFMLGFGLLLFGTDMLRDTLSFMKGSVSTQGTVLNAGTGKAPSRVVFRTTGGGSVTFSPGPIWGADRGDKVKVRYQKIKPQRSAQLENFAQLWAVPVLIMVLGMFFIAGGINLRTHRFISRAKKDDAVSTY